MALQGANYPDELAICGAEMFQTWSIYIDQYSGPVVDHHTFQQNFPDHFPIIPPLSFPLFSHPCPIDFPKSNDWAPP